jgi:hypothetical protein
MEDHFVRRRRLERAVDDDTVEMEVSPLNQWIEDFQTFAALFGFNAAIGQWASSRARRGLPLDLGWVHGDERFLYA